MTIQKYSKKKLIENENTYYSLHTEEYKIKNAKYALEHADELKVNRIKHTEKTKQYNDTYKAKNIKEIRKKAAEYQKKKRDFTKFIRPLYDLESLKGETFTIFYNRMKKERDDKEKKENQN